MILTPTWKNYLSLSNALTLKGIIYIALKHKHTQIDFMVSFLINWSLYLSSLFYLFRYKNNLDHLSGIHMVYFV